MFPTDIASMYAARPGRSTFAPAMAAGEGAAAGPRALRGQGTPLLNYEPVQGPTINAGFEVPRGMSRFEANQYYMTHGIPGDVVYARSNPPMPYPTSRNAFEEANVLAANKTRPSPAPANYDYQGPVAPGSVTQRPMSDFDRASIGANWSGTGKGQYGRFIPGNRQGPFRPEDYPAYSPEEMGQGVALRGETMPMVQRGGVPAVRSGLPTMAQGEYQAPYGSYGEFRDVTGNVLTGPAGVAQSPLAGGFPYGKAAAIGAGIGLPAMMAYYGSQGQGPVAGVPAMDQGARGAQMLPPIDVYGRPMAGAKAAPATPAARAAPATTRGGKKAAPTPPRRPAEAPAEPAWEGNINYHVTRAIDALLGQNEAERGRQYQQYYEQNPY
ncbi:MAG: hypothetical protein EBU34_11875 [Alphaproteobacteria bacterium]|nr:hypothetical protein [Alphaproteobacteria bacterium]